MNIKNKKTSGWEAEGKRRRGGKLEKLKPEFGGPEAHGHWRQGGRQQVSARGSTIEKHTLCKTNGIEINTVLNTLLLTGLAEKRGDQLQQCFHNYCQFYLPDMLKI